MTNTSNNPTPPKAPGSSDVKQDQQNQSGGNQQADGKQGADNKPAQQK